MFCFSKTFMQCRSFEAQVILLFIKGKGQALMVQLDVGILDLSNKSNTNIYKKLIFRVKVLIFRFGCSQTLNPSVEEPK